MNLNLRISVDGKDIDVIRELIPNIESLEKDFMRQPAYIAWINVMVSEADNDYQLAKLHRERVEASLYELFLKTAAERKEKSSDVRAQYWIVMQPEFEEAKKEEIESVRVLHDLQALRQGYMDKSGMLMQLGASYRKEMETLNIDSSEMKDRVSGRGAAVVDEEQLKLDKIRNAHRR